MLDISCRNNHCSLAVKEADLKYFLMDCYYLLLIFLPAETMEQPKSTSGTSACQAAVVGAGVLADKALLHYGIGVATEAEVNAPKAEYDVCVYEAAGLKFLNAGADAKTGTAAAGCSVTPVQAEAFSKASGAEASARAGLIKGVVEASTRAVAGETQARAGVGMKDLGAHAGT